MIDALHKLEVTAEELAVIENALHTQSQILNVQANAGGSDARLRLNAVKRVLASVSQQTPCAATPARPCKTSWFAMSRIFG